MKRAINRFSAHCLSLEKAHKAIHDAAFRAVGGIKFHQPYKVDGPIEIETEFMSTAEASISSVMPGSIRKNHRVVAYTGKDPVDAYKGFLLSSSSAARPLMNYMDRPGDKFMNIDTDDKQELLTVNGLTKFFKGLRAVNNFNLRLKSGEILGIIGPNGAGKTTIFNLLTGNSLQHPGR